MHNRSITTHRSQARQRVSARRAAAYERPADGGLDPQHFFDSRVKLAAVCPETALMYAVLENALLCFHKQFEPDQRFMRHAREAEDWFYNDDSRRLFSFLSICDALELEPRYIRLKLKHWTASPLSSHLKI
jgi:hypothetical protein